MGWATLSARNPRLIYAAISGFGQTGPYRERGGFDLVTQGMSGLMSVCGPKDGPPHRMPIAISDVAAGMHLAIGILCALEARHHTGRGQLVETSLLESALSFGVYEAAHVAATGATPPRLGQAHRGSSPYQVFPTADGWITLGAAQDNFWIRLCDLLGAPGAERGCAFCQQRRPRAQQRRAGGPARAATLGQSRPRIGWRRSRRRAFRLVRCWNSTRRWPIRMSWRGAWRSIPQHPAAGTVKTLGIPVKLSDTPGALRRPAPRLGEHTAEVLEGAPAANRPAAAAAGR